MKARYVLLITAVCLVAALVVTISPAQSRVLTESEMRLTVGGIGNGCPCNYQEGIDTCKGIDGCRTCVTWTEGQDPKSCPGNGFEFSQNNRTVCRTEQTNPKKCYWSPLEKKCKKSWNCTTYGTPRKGYKCEIFENEKICTYDGPADQYCRDCMRLSSAGDWSTYYNENCLSN